jgi:hypothetical protein
MLDAGWAVATARTAARTDRGTPRGPRSMHTQSNAQRPPWQRLRPKRGCDLASARSMARWLGLGPRARRCVATSFFC